MHTARVVCAWTDSFTNGRTNERTNELHTQIPRSRSDAVLCPHISEKHLRRRLVEGRQQRDVLSHAERGGIGRVSLVFVGLVLVVVVVVVVVVVIWWWLVGRSVGWLVGWLVGW